MRLRPSLAVSAPLRRVLAGLMVVLAGTVSAHADEVHIYSARQEALILPVLESFTEKTGIAVKLVTGKAAQLHQRLVAEGRNTPADILMTVDAGNLHRAAEADLLQRVDSSVLKSRVPEAFLDPEGRWFGLSLRARVIVYAPDRVERAQLSTYEDLADERWADRFIVRSSSNIYNQSLIASLIAAHGVEKTEAWARGLVENFARPPQGGDTDQIRAVAAGEADLSLVNTYYYGRLASSDDPDDQAVVAATDLFFPNQAGRGTHINVSGAGVTRHAKRAAEAVRLLEYLVSDEGQRQFAELNHEIPVVETVSVSPVVAGWGDFKKDDLPLSKLGELNGEAVRLADRAGWR